MTRIEALRTMYTQITNRWRAFKGITEFFSPLEVEDCFNQPRFKNAPIFSSVQFLSDNVDEGIMYLPPPLPSAIFLFSTKLEIPLHFFSKKNYFIFSDNNDVL